jgi:hypothetical protein
MKSRGSTRVITELLKEFLPESEGKTELLRVLLDEKYFGRTDYEVLKEEMAGRLREIKLNYGKA